MRYFTIHILLLILFGCSKVDKKQDGKMGEKRFKEQLNSQDLLKPSLNHQGKLLHIVFFKLKPNKNVDILIEELNRLKMSPNINELILGNYQELGDPRAFKEYDLMMQIYFQDTISYRRYQEGKIHAEVKSRTQHFLAIPPLTYDALIK